MDHKEIYYANSLSVMAQQLAQELNAIHAEFAAVKGPFYFILDRPTSLPLGSIQCVRFIDNEVIGQVLPGNPYQVQWNSP